ncbi:MAG: S9 family peptidase [Bacteroidia bacterium]|nr:S9 family peptidase [Bacteroidia bacterium]
MNKLFTLSILILSFACMSSMYGQGVNSDDVFNLEYASDPQISPDGKQVVYSRRSLDIMKDNTRSSLWIINADGSAHRPLAEAPSRLARWSPDGKKLIYISAEGDGAQIYLRWMDSGITTPISYVQNSPFNIRWSPDGNWIAFNMFVPGQAEMPIPLPKKPEGAEWAKPPVYIDDVTYRSDGGGFNPAGFAHVFILPADGGTARQLTEGDNNFFGAVSWTKDGKSLILSANIHEDKDYEPANSELYKLDIASGKMSALTDRLGPDSNPKVSPDGKMIAYTGNDEKYLGYQLNQLYVMDSDGRNKKLISGDFDRDVMNPQWDSESKGFYFQYDDEGITYVAHMKMNGKVRKMASKVGGTTLGRPYASGSYSISSEGTFAYTINSPTRPADVAIGMDGVEEVTQITNLNEDLFGHKEVPGAESIWWKSSYDDRKIQGWVVRPPDFDPNKKYPLLLEIHGGPFTNYGERFSAEVQLYASAGYVVLYTNPRGSTSYGQEFGNLIHHNYPSNDYDDLMSGVDAVIEKGFIDEDHLYVTGGSGGGVLTAWIVGHTDRFRAAVVAKPVINWTSFALVADNPAFFSKYWFGGFPWEKQENFWQRSPLAHVGNVSTPTMVLCGESDLRTPISESEQFYTALKLRKIETALVRIPGAYHGIAARPSNLITKVNAILYWFDKYKD